MNCLVNRLGARFVATLGWVKSMMGGKEYDGAGLVKGGVKNKGFYQKNTSTKHIIKRCFMKL
ncbi:hypothetical protein [Bartonella machadoae]|uniref:hypothetical protein n=1 Tax=Bartonella machadoae TaxID=2893471 RepID=UPI001F4D1917|nr:hypothetical protein [Bartonella machadoae]UNE53974.1 hypothetical protein LNM86_10435 [Bartonella machadoae]